MKIVQHVNATALEFAEGQEVRYRFSYMHAFYITCNMDVLHCYYDLTC